MLTLVPADTRHIPLLAADLNMVLCPVPYEIGTTAAVVVRSPFPKVPVRAVGEPEQAAPVPYSN